MHTSTPHRYCATWQRERGTDPRREYTLQHWRLYKMAAQIRCGMGGVSNYTTVMLSNSLFCQEQRSSAHYYRHGIIVKCHENMCRCEYIQWFYWTDGWFANPVPDDLACIFSKTQRPDTGARFHKLKQLILLIFSPFHVVTSWTKKPSTHPHNTQTTWRTPPHQHTSSVASGDKGYTPTPNTLTPVM